MIEKIEKKERKHFRIILIIATIATAVALFLSLMIGHYGILKFSYIIAIFLNRFGFDIEVSKSFVNIIKLIRLPRAIASFFVGSSLSIAGMVYQNTFNNKLISPDILGVSAGACVGAGLAILLGISKTMVSVFAFSFGLVAVFIALALPRLFKNKSTIALVLSGVIVSAFMNSVIGLIKYLADKSEKLASITYWMMGAVTGISIEEIGYVLPFIVIPSVVLILMSNKIDVVSLGEDEAQSLGIDYKKNRLIIVICSTLLTAASVSISGNVGWVGLVIPHISRIFVGNRSKFSMPVSFVFGGCFMMIVDTLSRTLSKDDIPLSIITGIFGAIIYSIILSKKGSSLND